MEISLGFIISFILVLFPGLIIRRLFYYGEFSKQFGGGLSLIKLLAVASIPGLINLVVIFFFYDNLVSHTNLEEIINTFKDLNNPEQHIGTNSSISIRNELISSLLPFLGLLYTSSIIIGMMAGRLIRITRIDTKYKLLRFKNYWFYVFSGELIKFKKMKHMLEVNKKHLFTVADILVDSDGKSKLYSGIVVDYEINEENCQVLNKVILQHAERYKFNGDDVEKVKIPGNLFVIDCSKMKNINLTYIYEESTNFLQSKFPSIITTAFAVFLILIIPFCIFKTDYITWSWYQKYFNLHWYEQILFYYIVTQFVGIFNPFTRKGKENEFKYVGFKVVFYKIAVFAILLITFCLIIT